MVSPRPDIVAYHEAGHAVVAAMLGLKVVHVNILDGGAGAHSESATYAARDLDNETYLAAISKDITVALAGSYAQQRHRPVSAKRQPAEWEDDRQVATSLGCRAALVASGVERDQIDLAMLNNLNSSQQVYANHIFRQCGDRARELVADHWPVIVKVAKALLSRPILNADDLDRLIGSKPSTSP
jgi:ATP-dependent Zn protease